MGALIEKIGGNQNLNEHPLMGWSETHTSLKFKRYMTLTPPHEQKFHPRNIGQDVVIMFSRRQAILGIEIV